MADTHYLVDVGTWTASCGGSGNGTIHPDRVTCRRCRQELAWLSTLCPTCRDVRKVNPLRPDGPLYCPSCKQREDLSRRLLESLNYVRACRIVKMPMSQLCAEYTLEDARAAAEEWLRELKKALSLSVHVLGEEFYLDVEPKVSQRTVFLTVRRGEVVMTRARGTFATRSDSGVWKYVGPPDPIAKKLEEVQVSPMGSMLWYLALALEEGCIAAAVR